jgi:hypothetical protein
MECRKKDGKRFKYVKIVCPDKKDEYCKYYSCCSYFHFFSSVNSSLSIIK